MALEKAIYYDASKCSGCKGCQVACKQWNQLASPLYAEDYEFTGSYESPLENDSNTWLHMTFDEHEGEGPKDFVWAFGRDACHHCTEAGCVMACPTGACHHVENGAVVIDPDICIGCKFCETGCPYHIPKFSSVEHIERKCWFCMDRLDQGRRPACVDSCTTHALDFGDREQMVALGRARVEQIKEKYPKAYLYGDTELGGLHVLDVLPLGPESVGLPADPSIPLFRVGSNVLKPAAGIGFAATLAVLAAARINGRGYHRDADALKYDPVTDDTIVVGRINQVGFESAELEEEAIDDER